VRNKRFPSPLQRIAERLQTINLDDLEKIDPFCLAPWQAGMEARIPEREDAEKWTGMSNEVKVFVDASYRNHNAGIGLYCPLENQGKVVEDRRAIALGCCEGLTATHIEIKAIQRALLLVSDFWSTETVTRFGAAANVLTYVVVSDSQAAIKGVSRPCRQSGQLMLRQINQLASEIRDRGGPKVRLQWVPAHAKMRGNEIANALAREATTSP
jgi:ribonuclease HI